MAHVLLVSQGWVAQVAELHRLAKRQVQLQLALAAQQRAAAAMASCSMYPYAYGGFPTMTPLAPAAGAYEAAAADTDKPAGARPSPGQTAPEFGTIVSAAGQSVGGSGKVHWWLASLQADFAVACAIRNSPCP